MPISDAASDSLRASQLGSMWNREQLHEQQAHPPESGRAVQCSAVQLKGFGSVQFSAVRFS